MPTVSPRAGAVRALVAEDESNLRDELCELLAELWPELDVCARVGDGAEALRRWAEIHPDVVFLDIQMPGVSGLEVARRIGTSSRCVFVTAHDEFAIAAFEQGAVDYVLKPFRRERLAATVARLRTQLDVRPDIERVLDGLARRLAAPREYLRWITAAHGTETSLITAEEICFFQARDKCTVVATADREAVISRTIRDLASVLDPASFWQIHRGTIVNVRHVAGVSRNLRGQLCVRLRRRTDVLPVSAPYSHLFRHM